MSDGRSEQHLDDTAAAAAVVPSAVSEARPFGDVCNHETEVKIGQVDVVNSTEESAAAAAIAAYQRASSQVPLLSSNQSVSIIPQSVASGNGDAVSRLSLTSGDHCANDQHVNSRTTRNQGQMDHSLADPTSSGTEVAEMERQKASQDGVDSHPNSDVAHLHKEAPSDSLLRMVPFGHDIPESRDELLKEGEISHNILIGASSASVHGSRAMQFGKDVVAAAMDAGVLGGHDGNADLSMQCLSAAHLNQANSSFFAAREPVDVSQTMPPAQAAQAAEAARVVQAQVAQATQVVQAAHAAHAAQAGLMTHSMQGVNADHASHIEQATQAAQASQVAQSVRAVQAAQAAHAAQAIQDPHVSHIMEAHISQTIGTTQASDTAVHRLHLAHSVHHAHAMHAPLAAQMLHAAHMAHGTHSGHEASDFDGMVRSMQVDGLLSIQMQGVEGGMDSIPKMEMSSSPGYHATLPDGEDGALGGAEPARKKRRQFLSDDERRQARILKNRRTAEESRQRRLRKMKELEEISAKETARANALEEEVATIRAQLTALKERLNTSSAGIPNYPLASNDARAGGEQSEGITAAADEESAHENLNSTLEPKSKVQTPTDVMREEIAALQEQLSARDLMIRTLQDELSKVTPRTSSNSNH